MEDKEHCKLCLEPLPKIALYTLNRIAIKRGYCSWVCLAGALDPEKVNKLLRDRRDNKSSEIR